MSYTFPVETSARHVHLTAEDFATLFGADAQLTVKKELSIKGQFASNEKVTVVGPKKSQANVSILGPFRSKSQVELSATDARSLGLNAPVRLSGDLAGSAPCKLVGPAGEVQIHPKALSLQNVTCTSALLKQKKQTFPTARSSWSKFLPQTAASSLTM